MMQMLVLLKLHILVINIKTTITFGEHVNLFSDLVYNHMIYKFNL